MESFEKKREGERRKLKQRRRQSKREGEKTELGWKVPSFPLPPCRPLLSVGGKRREGGGGRRMREREKGRTERAGTTDCGEVRFCSSHTRGGGGGDTTHCSYLVPPPFTPRKSKTQWDGRKRQRDGRRSGGEMRGGFFLPSIPHISRLHLLLFLLPPPFLDPKARSKGGGGKRRQCLLRRRRRVTVVVVVVTGLGRTRTRGATFSIAWIDKKCLPSKVAAVGKAVVHPEGCVLTRRD